MRSLPRAAFREALNEAARVLEPGGLFELTMHREGGPDGVRADDDMPIARWFTYWAAGDLRAELERAAFTVKAIDQPTPFANRARARRT